MYENLPYELKKNALFCAWKKNEIKGYVPYDFKENRIAKSGDKNTFCDFEFAISNIDKYYKKENNKVVGGLGLGIFNGFSAINIDHCIENGNINEFAKEIIEYFNSYTEISPSGTGIRIIFKTNFEFDKLKYHTNNQKIGLEFYFEGATAKFVTLTGNVLYSYLTDIRTVEDLEPLLKKYMLKSDAIDINDLLKKDKKLKELWNKQSTENESKDDLALCGKLAFYLKKDAEKINELFLKSPHYKFKDKTQIEKWEQKGDETISNAVANCISVYNPDFYASSSFDFTDTGNAHVFVEKFGDVIKYNVDNKCFMIWNGIFWEYDSLNKIKVLAEDFIQEMKIKADFSNKDSIKNITRLLSSKGKELMLKETEHLSGIPCTNADFDSNKYYFNCRSGVLDLKNMKLLKHEQCLMQSKFSDVELTDKQPKLFLKFLEETYGGNKDLINYVLTIHAICLTGDTSERKAFYLVGDGANGKSVLADVMSCVLGEYAMTAAPELLIDKKFQNQATTELAKLKGARYVVVSETKMGDKLNESAVKTMTGGGDKIIARFLYKNEFEYFPEFKIFVLTNYEPTIVGTDNGIKQRIKIIKHNHTVDDKKQDKNLTTKLKAEKNEIFSLLVKYYSKYLKTGLIEPECVTNWNKEYFESNDIVAVWLEERCVFGDEYITSANKLWNSFLYWYMARNEFYKFSQTQFGRNLSKKFNKFKSSGTVCYQGLAIKEV